VPRVDLGGRSDVDDPAVADDDQPRSMFGPAIVTTVPPVMRRSARSAATGGNASAKECGRFMAGNYGEAWPHAYASATYEDLLKVREHGRRIDRRSCMRRRGLRDRHECGVGAWLLSGTAFSIRQWRTRRMVDLRRAELHFGRNVLVPDLGGWRRERMPQFPTNHIFDIVPDWVCEVSPSLAASTG
jgi:hypothetical protein